ncbi:MAG: ABC transporter permease [Bacteroidales bacterium]
MLERYKYIFNIALEAVFLNKFRSILTALGIIFGVAAVITMMAIGNGAKKVILDQMKLVGVNNILIAPKPEKQNGASSKSGDENAQSTQQSDNSEKGKYSPGLNLADAIAIKTIIPTVSKVSPEVIYETDIVKDGVKIFAKAAGVTPDFFHVFALELQEGQMFNEEQLKDGKSVCIIGPIIKSKFFPTENAVGKDIKCGQIWLKIIGVLKKREISQASIDKLGVSDYNNTIYTPIQTILRRYKDRSVITAASLHGSQSQIDENSFMVTESSGQDGNSGNQIDKIVVQVKESSQITPTVEILKKMMLRRHAGMDDVDIIVPELLLKQEQRAKDVFNIVLGAIASISLLVGGIGIMNIMLASVMERIKEIGIRQAIGATKRDIVLQFLMEATLLSLTGGLIGIILGLVLSRIISSVTDIVTIVSPLSVLVSFGVSASVGIIFGYMPSQRAARQDPVESLRHE